MAKHGGMVAWVGWSCFLVVALALGAMGQPPPYPSGPDGPWAADDLYLNFAYFSPNPHRVDYSKTRNKIYTCDMERGEKCIMQCPNACPKSCFISCADCETRCRCVDYPGESCGDPSFTGGDGVTFYFHGRRDKDFCIVSDTDLHINAHFIGNHNPVNERTFTWIQAIGVSFGDHQIYLGTRKAAEWDEEEDHIEITLDGKPVNIDTAINTRWVSKALPNLSVKRTDSVNSVKVDLAGVFTISASAVPISDEDSKIHNYGKTMKDSLAHLDLGFKFHSLTNNVDGVLGQTYRMDYINKMNVTAKMPIMGGAPKYLSSGLFSTDCAVSKFHRNAGGSDVLALAA